MQGALVVELWQQPSGGVSASTMTPRSRGCPFEGVKGGLGFLSPVERNVILENLGTVLLGFHEVLKGLALEFLKLRLSPLHHRRAGAYPSMVIAAPAVLSLGCF